MRPPLPALCCALMLGACAPSRPAPLPLAWQVPPPPQVALQPCTRTPLPTSPDGALTSAAAERALRERDIDLALCEARRRAAIEAWPEQP